MDTTNFKSGAPEDRYQYKAFLPTTIYHEWIIADPELSELLGRADRALGELNAFAQLITDMVAHGALSEITGQCRSRLFVVTEYIELFRR